jgi:hypothetical protein
MSDPQRTDADRPADTLAGRQRDARVEELLLAGLDHYFAGRYEQAIHIWTRVLFLDRRHARARAYIERARNALAERQRETDELLHQGTSAFESGEAGTARRLLTAAVERGAAPDVAFAYLDRLDRLEPVLDAGTGSAAAASLPRENEGHADPGRHRTAGWRVALVVGGLAVVVGVGGYLAAALDTDSDHSPPAILPVPVVKIPVPQPSALVIHRARRLLASGRPRDALRLMGAIPATDTRRAEADRLMAEIQEALLDGRGEDATERVAR